MVKGASFFYISAILVALAYTPADAKSIIRVSCDDADTGVEVLINGEIAGECPIDIPVKAGMIHLFARKPVDQDHEMAFEKDFRLGEGVAQRVELVLSGPRLTNDAKNRQLAAEAKRAKEAAAEEAKRLKDAAEADAKEKAETAKTQLTAAEAGDVDAMNKVASFYDTGMGVKKNLKKSEYWRNKAEVTTTQRLLASANAGDTEAMERVAACYDSGKGVIKDPEKANKWRIKYQEAAAQKLLAAAVAGDVESMDQIAKLYDVGQGVKGDPEQAKFWRTKADAVRAQEHEKQKLAKINAYSLFPWERDLYRGFEFPDNITKSALWVFAPFVVALFDITSLPYHLTELNRLKKEAAFRPSTWGKPDSMIAQYAQRTQKTLSADATITLTASIK